MRQYLDEFGWLAYDLSDNQLHVLAQIYAKTSTGKALNTRAAKAAVMEFWDHLQRMRTEDALAEVRSE